MKLEGSGEGMAVSRDEIVDIDHPGSVAALIGSTLGLVTLPFAIWGYIEVEYSGGASDELEFWMTAAWLADFAFIAYSVWGFVTWIGSRSAAEPLEVPEKPKIAPVALHDGEKTCLGLGLSWSW